MINKRYAFLVENEIFDIFEIGIGTSDEEIYYRWLEGFSNNATGLDITNFPTARIGSILNENSFDNSEVLEKHLHVQESGTKTYGMLSNNKIFMIVVPTDKYLQTMYEAAFQTGNITGMDITDFPEATQGSVWNNGMFIAPNSNL
jgi:hypothetical protein